MKTKNVKKHVLGIGISTIFLVFATSLSAGSIMVKCEGIKVQAGGCKEGCYAKPLPSKMMTLEECQRAGGTPTQVEKTDH